jgi:hypothetical protein
MSVPASPPAARRRVPTWFAPRLVLGVLLVLVSVLVGARLFVLADRTVRVWAAARGLGAGTVLNRSDLVAVPVRLPQSAGRYLAVAGPTPVGRPLARDVGAGELLPRGALAGQVCGSEVSIPVSSRHLPSTVARGARVDVFATAPADRGGETGQVLAGVTVQAVVGTESGLASAANEAALVVRVGDALAPAVVRAVRTAEIDVVVVAGPRGGDGCGLVSTTDDAAPSSLATPSGDATSEPAPGGTGDSPSSPAPTSSGPGG